MSRREIRPVAGGQPVQDQGSGNAEAKTAAVTSAEAFRARYAAEFDPRNSFFPTEVAPAEAPSSVKPDPAAAPAPAAVTAATAILAPAPAPVPASAPAKATAAAPPAARISRPSLLAGAIVAGVGLLLAGAGLGYVFFGAPRAPVTGSPDAAAAVKRVAPPTGAASGAVTSVAVPPAPPVDGAPAAAPAAPATVLPRTPAPANRGRGAIPPAAPATIQPAAVLPVASGSRSSVTHTRSDLAAPAGSVAAASAAVETTPVPVVVPRPAAALPPGCTEALSALGLCGPSTK